MTDSHRDDADFIRTIQAEAERAQRGRRKSFCRGLGLVGSIGWMISVPLTAGAMAGRWLDGRAQSGVFWTLALLLLGLLLGAASVWRHVHKELSE